MRFFLPVDNSSSENHSFFSDFAKQNGFFGASRAALSHLAFRRSSGEAKLPMLIISGCRCYT